MTHCVATTKSGAECKAPTLEDGRYCFFHDPRPEPERQRAHSLGGQRTSPKRTVLPSNYPPVKLRKPKDVSRFLSGLCRCVLVGELDAQLASPCGYLASCALSAMQAGDESRVTRVEFLLQQQQTSTVPEDKFMVQFLEEKKKAEEKERRNPMKILLPYKATT